MRRHEIFDATKDITQLEPGVDAGDVKDHLWNLVLVVCPFNSGLDVGFHGVFPELFASPLLLLSQFRTTVTVELSCQVFGHIHFRLHPAGMVTFVVVLLGHVNIALAGLGVQAEENYYLSDVEAKGKWEEGDMVMTYFDHAPEHNSTSSGIVFPANSLTVCSCKITVIN